MPSRPIITLTTDFGDTDYFVGVMKGVILSIQPEALIVDLTHNIRPQDLFDGAFLIHQTCRYFPAQTIHCVVVDPGVGTARRPIVASAENQFFVAPDNGVLSLVLEEAAEIQVVHATATHYFRDDKTPTFQGRSIFAPLAAWISRGVKMESMGPPITDFIRLKSPQARQTESNKVRGAILKIDHFGNCITNIDPKLLPGFFNTPRPAFMFRVGNATIARIQSTFEEASSPEPFIFLGSTGCFEIGINHGSAAELLKLSRGMEIEVSW
ncbi:MAG: SAM-dependent chlorinase/fluorinase [Acidobacteriia bacterium]|nr:SAM-dependent chlorinase/fluorinase [Terriglobia bacterium]